jgi:hypothetical protein
MEIIGIMISLAFERQVAEDRKQQLADCELKQMGLNYGGFLRPCRKKRMKEFNVKRSICEFQITCHNAPIAGLGAFFKNVIAANVLGATLWCGRIRLGARSEPER